MPHVPTPPAPSADKRWKLVTTSLRRQGNAPHALIEGMHAVQQAFGHLEPASLRYLAAALGVPLSKAYGVATFYHHFVLEPPGAHTCVVCLGTACHLKGGPAILSAVERAHRVKAGQTTAGGELSLLVARCIGVCSLAPAVVLDGDIQGPCTPAQVLERLAPCFEEPEGSPR
ncbi:MAG: hydrogenase HoxE [Proteobacteria bacterium]|nr:MAG: hydrogenase HoxE [Pseudomonadota bacterium]